VYVAMTLTYSYVAALDVTNGDLVWNSSQSIQNSHSLAVTAYEGRVFNPGNTYGGMYSFNASTGEAIWRVRYVDDDEWTPAVYLDRTYAFESRRLYVNDAATGDTIGYFRPDTLDTSDSRWSLGQGNAPLLVYRFSNNRTRRAFC
jgi:outer membrane protein assembly factor BamB